MTEYEFNKKLGSALRYERKRRSYTIIDVASRLNISKSTVAAWETGERTISAKQWKMYCDLLNMSLDEFVERHDL